MNPAIDILKVCDIAKQAGAEIMRLRPAVVGKAVIKSDGSPVTEADQRASAIVCGGLAQLTPHIPVISEENPEAENRAILANNDTCWIVDPLDGTRSFIDGFDGFGVHIALVDGEQPVMAAIYFPARGVLYYTDGVSGAFRQEDGKPAERIFVNDKIDAGQPLRAAMSWVKSRRPQVDGCQVTPLVGGDRVCGAAENKVDIGVLEGPFSYWDIAAAHALVKAAGGDLFDLASGNPVTYPRDKLHILPAIGGHAAVVDAWREKFCEAIAKLQKPKPAQPKP